jgi:histidine ammonia-lyase
MADTRVIDAAADLDAAAIRQVSAGLQIRLGPALVTQLQAQCELGRAALRSGAEAYGVTSGMGALSSVRLSDAEQRVHQQNLLLGRATGGPPWLPEADVRGIIAVRLATFLTGDAVVSADLCQALTNFLAAGLIPAVPQGGAGCAGEIIQLAHCFGPLIGIGPVLRPTRSGGPPTELMPAASALAEHGLPAYELGPKEGIALLAGVPGATALSILAAAEATTVAAMMTAAAGLSIAAIQAPADPYLAACARGDDILGEVLSQIRTLIEPAAPRRMLQAPVSFRVTGPVLAQVARAARGLSAATDRALAGVTDSPAFLDGRFVSTAGFHGIDLAAQCDHLTGAVTHAAEVSAARIHRLLDSRVTGLPAQLADRPGPQAGLVAVHKRAAGEVHAMRRLALPTTAGLIETSGGQEDVQSFAWDAAVNLRSALRRARTVAAAEALTAFRAASLGGRPLPLGSDALLRTLSKIVRPIDGDRQFGADIELLLDGSWSAQPDA